MSVGKVWIEVSHQDMHHQESYLSNQVHPESCLRQSFLNSAPQVSLKNLRFHHVIPHYYVALCAL